MQFEYTARNQLGEAIKGTIEADSQAMAADLLMSRDLIVTKLVSVTSGQEIFARINSFFGQVNKKDLAIYLRQLSILISAAMPLVQALRILSQQDMKPALKSATATIVNDVEGGMKFSQALESYPGIFNEYFINIIRSGESTGRLEDVLNYLATQQERDYELESKIRGALAYPIFIICVMIAAGVGIMVFILPKMLEMITALGASTDKLPITTRILMGISYVTQNYWWLVLIVLAVCIIGFIVYVRTPDGKRTMDVIKLKVPIFGNLFRSIYLVRFTQSFRTILVGGVTIPTGLRIVKDVVGSPIFERIVADAVREVEEGNPVSTVFLKSKEIPSMVSQMLTVGEQTGRLDDVLEKITEFYTREITSTTETTLKLIEPAIMLLLGVAVAVMVSGIIMPMFELAGSVE